MDKNRGPAFGFFCGIALCVLFYLAFAITPSPYGLIAVSYTHLTLPTKRIV